MTRNKLGKGTPLKYVKDCKCCGNKILNRSQAAIYCRLCSVRYSGKKKKSGCLCKQYPK